MSLKINIHQRQKYIYRMHYHQLLFSMAFKVVNIQLDFSVFHITLFSGGQNEVVRYFSCCVFGS